LAGQMKALRCTQQAKASMPADEDDEEEDE
jgi:hypothetical protein